MVKNPMFSDMSPVIAKLNKIAAEYTGELKPTIIRSFQAAITRHYQTNGRIFSWRAKITPYRIIVSEIMLQQTQTDRVAKKFTEFTKLFPSFLSLSRATRADVIRAWQGLGYNRRALFLHTLAQTVIQKYHGRVPKNTEELIALPGIGKNTAGSIAAFAFNQPTIFIETNIRSVFLHTFFSNQTNIPDTKIIPLIEMTLDQKNPRQWYWALMDVGVILKKAIGNPSRASQHYSKQTRFQGSNRQIRGAIVRALSDSPILTFARLMNTLSTEGITDRSAIEHALDTLLKDGFVTQKNGLINIKK